MIYIVLGILFTIKHFLADWYFQSPQMSVGKRAGGWEGIGYLAKHASVHSILTLPVVALVGSMEGVRLLGLAIIISSTEFVLHFSIDYGKIAVEKANAIAFKTPSFWALLAVDQSLHFTCYLLFIVWVVKRLS